MTSEAAAVPRLEPFRHATCRNFLPAALLEETLSWMQEEAPWRLRVASFYEQWELHLSPAVLPQKLHALLASKTIADIKRRSCRADRGGQNPLCRGDGAQARPGTDHPYS